MPLGNQITEKIKSPENIAQNLSSEIEYEISDPKYSLDDIIVSNSTLEDISLVISLKQDFDRVFKDMGFQETHKYSKKFIVNFYGEPGTGKTLAAHAIAKKFNKKIIIVDYSQIESKYVGDTPKNLKKLFSFAEKNDYLIFFDEADAILSRRVTNMQSATDTSVNQTRSVLLNILNDFQGDVIFATNFITNYDPAFMRRISKHVFFSLPDQEARVKIFEKYLPKKMQKYSNIPALAIQLNGLSAADIEKGVLMAAFQASSAGKTIIEQSDIIQQMQIILKNKQDNTNKADSFTSNKIVSKDYVEKQIGVSLP